MQEHQNDWLDRTRLLLGDEKLKKLKQAHVLVAGLGGVGANAAEQLCRAGIGALTLIDNDQVQLTNINRQLPALHSTIGSFKANILADRFMDINPDLKISIHKEYLKDHNLEKWTGQQFDYVVDAIDTLSPKVFYLFHCVKNKQKVVSSMGAGGKLDPAQVKVAEIEDTHTCKLAFLVRKKLHKLNVRKGFKAVFSTEKVSSESVIQVDNEPNKKTTVGTISYLPAVFGCFCASVVIRELSEN